MRKLLRLGPLVLVSLAALVGAGEALAEFKPQIFVTSTKPVVGAAGIKIRYVSARLQEPTANVKIAVPKGYVTATAGSAGARIGSATASVLLTDPNRIVTAKGSLQIASASEFAPQATGCTGTASHSATWVLSLNAAGTVLRVPIFVDAISTGPSAAFASSTLELCLAAPDTPRGSPGRAPLGAKLLTLTLTAGSIKNPAAGGIYRWRATATPYNVGVGTANASGTVEVQSLSVVPLKLTLEGTVGASRKQGFRRVSLSGLLSANAVGINGIFVDLLRGGKKFATLTTKKGGVFAATGDIKRGGGSTFVARATTPDKDLGGGSCVATFTPIPCQDATLPGFTLASNVVRLGL